MNFNTSVDAKKVARFIFKTVLLFFILLFNFYILSTAFNLSADLADGKYTGFDFFGVAFFYFPTLILIIVNTIYLPISYRKHPNRLVKFLINTLALVSAGVFIAIIVFNVQASSRNDKAQQAAYDDSHINLPTASLYIRDCKVSSISEHNGLVGIEYIKPINGKRTQWVRNVHDLYDLRILAKAAEEKCPKIRIN